MFEFKEHTHANDVVERIEPYNWMRSGASLYLAENAHIVKMCFVVVEPLMT